MSQRPASAVISVAVVADIRLYRDGLANILDKEPEITVVGAASSDLTDVARVLGCRPDVVVVDMAMWSSASVARVVAKTAPQVRVVGLGVPVTETDLLACAETGIVGCVARDGTLDDLLSAVRGAARGEALYSPEVIALLLQRIAVRAEWQQPTGRDRLTAREQEIVGLLARGWTNREIAVALFIEPATVKNHVHHILEKLRVRRRADVAASIHVQDKEFIRGEDANPRV